MVTCIYISSKWSTGIVFVQLLLGSSKNLFQNDTKIVKMLKDKNKWFEKIGLLEKVSPNVLDLLLLEE